MIGSMGRWKRAACACVVITAVAVVLIAPAYTLQPTALRAWNASLVFLAALGTLVVLSFSVPDGCERLLMEAERLSRACSDDLLSLTCTLLI